MEQDQEKRGITAEAAAPLRAVFMGTPAFAAKVLSHVLESPAITVAAVYTQPDRPCGRGHKCQVTPVKALALEHGLDVLQPASLKGRAEQDELAALSPDVLLVAAYGLILPKAVLDIPRMGSFNTHGSLLPKWRGAAPIQRSLLAGEHVTGMSIMLMEEGLDSGPVVLQRALKVSDTDTTGTLMEELADMGGRLLVEAMERLREGRLAIRPQDHSRATLAPKIAKHEAFVDFRATAPEVHDRIRAMTPSPGAHGVLDIADKAVCVRLGLGPGRVDHGAATEASPGTVLGLQGDALAVACGAGGVYLLPLVKPEGKAMQPAPAFANGYLKGSAARFETATGEDGA